MMNTNKTLPILLSAALLIGSGTLLATAQDTGNSDQTVEVQEQSEERRGHHGKRHAREGHRHGGRHGRRGGRHGMVREVFGMIDTDGDGKVTRAEVEAFRTAQVAAADVGGDGALSIEEFDTLFRQFTRTRMVRAFQRLDRDGDGIISAVEMDRPMERMIERMDRDGDGVLTLKRGRGKRG